MSIHLPYFARGSHHSILFAAASSNSNSHAGCSSETQHVELFHCFLLGLYSLCPTFELEYYWEKSPKAMEAMMLAPTAVVASCSLESRDPIWLDCHTGWAQVLGFIHWFVRSLDWFAFNRYWIYLFGLNYCLWIPSLRRLLTVSISSGDGREERVVVATALPEGRTDHPCFLHKKNSLHADWRPFLFLLGILVWKDLVVSCWRNFDSCGSSLISLTNLNGYSFFLYLRISRQLTNQLYLH